MRSIATGAQEEVILRTRWHCTLNGVILKYFRVYNPVNYGYAD